MAEKNVLDFLRYAIAFADEIGGSPEELWLIYEGIVGEEKKEAILIILEWAAKGDNRIITDRALSEARKLGIFRDALKILTK